MEDLIQALSIFARYTKAYAPTHCEHDVFYVVGVGKDTPSAEEKNRLETLGFFWSEDNNAWASFRFGSA